MSDTSMRDEHDPLLTRLFAAQEPTLPATDFMMQLTARLEREQGKERAYSIAAVIAMLVLGAVLAPWIAQVTSALVSLGGATTNAIESVLASPIAWLIGGTLAFALLPVVYVWRTFRG